MQSALHITTKVLPGNRIKIQLPPLAEGKGAEGKDVDVFVVLPSTTTISTHYNDQTLTQVVETSTVRVSWLSGVECSFQYILVP